MKIKNYHQEQAEDCNKDASESDNSTFQYFEIIQHALLDLLDILFLPLNGFFIVSSESVTNLVRIILIISVSHYIPFSSMSRHIVFILS